MQLADYLDALTRTSPKDKEEVINRALNATKNMVWVPNPGPQTDAYFSEADELFYGGQAGGGKTDLELGLALTAHRRSLVLRRTNKEVLGLVERMSGILGSRDGFNSQSGMWRRPDDRVIDLGGVQLEEDKQKYKGIPHDLICVGKDTPVLMGDGSYKPVQDVQAGDSVMTLEGPRQVKRAFPVYDKESVEIHVTKRDGTVTMQVQSATHKILTNAGWVSPRTSDAAYPSPLLVDETRICRYPRKFSAKSFDKCESASQAQENLLKSARNNEQLLPTDSACPCFSRLSGLTADRAPRDPGTGSAMSDDAHVSVQPRRIYHRIAKALRGPSLRLASLLAQRSSFRHGACGVPRTSLPEGSPENCFYDFRRGGVHTPVFSDRRAELGDDPGHLPRQADVEPRSPSDLLKDETGTVPTHTLRMWSYAHPYTMGIRQSLLDAYYGSCVITPVGKRDLYDLEVEEVNHFITQGGIINKNCFDEVSDFTESQYTFILAWNRSAIPGQRCRVVAAGNPPTRPEGLWVLRRWAAWLDPQHHNPAQPGELRWYTSDTEGKEVEVDGRGPHEIDGQMVYARSRTFIPATLQDNPDLMATDYQASLDSLSGAERAAYRDGNFGAALQDDAMQTIPTAWIREAQARWTSTPPVGVPMCAMGVDIAQGGKDNMVIAIRHDGWYAPLIKIPGKQVPDGITAAGLVVAKRRDNARVIVDNGGGWGGDTVIHLVANGIDCIGYMGVKQSVRRSEDRKLSFFNIRTEAYWRFREALNPAQPQGSTICLPKSPTLVADLCAPTYEIIGSNVGGKVKVESKEDVCKRLGRSTDEGDAVVMAWFDGVRGANIAGGWKNFGANRNPKVIMKSHMT